MAAPLSICRFRTCGRLLSPIVSSQTFIKFKCPNVYSNAGKKLPSRSFANTMVFAGTPTTGVPLLNATKPHSDFFTTSSVFPAPLVSGSRSDKPCFWVPSRNYGRKRVQKPPKITHFEYSGDLRNLPQLDKDLVLYKYREIKDQLEGNEMLRKLTTLEFASSAEISDHRKQLIKDRMVALFGPDCELEQRIALLTLSIRLNIPRCLKFTTDKLNKSLLVGRINHRRNLLTSLRSLDHERFEWLLRELKIRYVIPKDREEHKGWKHDKRVAVQEEAREKQRKKLEQLKAKFEAEKKIFYEHKANMMSKIEEDLNKFGLDWDFLNNLIKAEQEALEKQQQEQLLWAAPVKEVKEQVAKKGKQA